jgi:pimeloyl-ACP methyl ester carboxylesterase
MRLAVSIISLVALTAFAGCAAWVDRRASLRETAAEADHPPEGQIIDVGGRAVHAVVAGSGPDLVLIHGASGNTRDFTFGFADMLTDRYRVIILDRPGMGYSDRAADAYDRAFARGAESPAEQAALLQAAAAVLGADRPIVLGHSYGGAVAMAWALNHPDHAAGIVNLSGATMPWPGGLGTLYAVNGSALGGALLPPLITAFAPEAQIEAVIDAIFAPDPAPPGYADHVGAGLSIRRDSLRANARQVNSLRPHVVTMAERYGEITLPVEIVHGLADTIVPPDIHALPLSRLIPAARLTLLPDVGHMPHHVDPASVIAAIDRVADAAGLR